MQNRHKTKPIVWLCQHYRSKNWRKRNQEERRNTVCSALKMTWSCFVEAEALQKEERVRTRRRLGKADAPLIFFL